MRALSRALGLCALLSGPAGAATTSTFQANAQIVPGCLVLGGVTRYGVLDFGTRSALSSAAVSTSLGGTMVTFQCTPGVVMSMSIDGGQHTAGGTRNLRRDGASQLLAYQLFSDAAFSQALAIGQGAAVNYNDPTSIRLPVYARVQLGASVPAGTYSDVLQVTVSW